MVYSYQDIKQMTGVKNGIGNVIILSYPLPHLSNFVAISATSPSHRWRHFSIVLKML